MTIVSWNISTFAYTLQELYNPSKLNAVFQQVGFIKAYHWSTQIFGPISIYGHMIDNSTDKAFLYLRDNLNNSYYKTYLLNGQNTIGLQVNGRGATPHINMTIQNANYDLSMSGLTAYNLASSWQKYYSESTQNFILSYNGHGIKQSTDDNDFLTGYYGSPGAIPTTTNGYGFVRFDALTGTIDQDFWYDLSLNDYTSIFHLYDDYADQSSFVCSGLMSLRAVPYFYLAERTLSASEPNCSTDIGLTEEDGSLAVGDETMTIIEDNQDRTSTTETVSATSVAITFEEICVDDARNVTLKESNINNDNVSSKISFLNNKVVVTSLKKEIREIVVYSADGKLIKAKTYSNSNNAELNFDKPLSAGIYFAKIIYSDNSNDYKKIFIH